MRHRIVEASTPLLLVLVVAALSSAQMAKPGDGLAIASEADVYGSPVGDGFQTQEAYLSSTVQKAPSYQPPGYVSGTIFDQSGAVSTGADVRLTQEGQISNQQVRSGSNGQFLFPNVAPGSFRLRVTAPGFTTREFSADSAPGGNLSSPSDYSGGDSGRDQTGGEGQSAHASPGRGHAD